MNITLPSEASVRIEEILADAGHGFELVDKGIERAGSLEWAVARRSSTIIEAVVVALTPEGDSDLQHARIELSAGADNGEHFRREVLYQDVVHDMNLVLAGLAARVEAGVDWLEHLGPNDLTAPHLVSDGRRGALARAAANHAPVEGPAHVDEPSRAQMAAARDLLLRVIRELGEVGEDSIEEPKVSGSVSGERGTAGGEQLRPKKAPAKKAAREQAR